MSDYKAYGFCDAGCRRRVPTYEEFESCAYGVSLPLESGYSPLEFGKTYRINNTNDLSSWGNLHLRWNAFWDCSIGMDIHKEYQWGMSFFERQKYKDDDGLLLCLKNVEAKKVSGACVQLTLYYLINNVLNSYVCEITDSAAEYYYSADELSYKFSIVNATSLTMVNPYATLTAESVKVWTTQGRDNIRAVFRNLPEEIMLTGVISDNDGIFDGTIHRARLLYLPQDENNRQRYEGECTIMLQDLGGGNARMAIGRLTIEVNDDLSVDVATFNGDYRNDNGNLETCIIGMLVNDYLNIVAYKGIPVTGG